MAALILKHFCKICRKGFACGRALGGHMRAHGILSDDTSTTPPSAGPNNHNVEDDDDPITGDWMDESNKPNVGSRRMYALRTNPNRLKTCRACENCGKEFLSWKSFLEHGKCTTTTTTSDELDSLISDDDDDEARRGSDNNNNWSKRKRSTRVKVGSPSPGSWKEEEELANCLMMLSNGAVEPMMLEEDDDEESCGSASKEDHSNHRLHRSNNNVRTKAISFIPPISYRLPQDQTVDKAKVMAPASKGLFECKACKKVFNSHQALGGHRASHKKVKGCFAARLDHMDLDIRDNDDLFEDSFFPTKPNNNNHCENGTLASTSKRKTKVHECSICHRIFSSGQALGGHKRCHWITSNATVTAIEPPPPSSSIAKILNFHDQQVGSTPPSSPLILPLDLKLDLNLPAPADEARRRGFQVSTEINLQSWVCKNDTVDEHDSKQQHLNDKHNVNKDENNMIIENEEENNGKKNRNNHNNVEVDDEGDSWVKLAKLSELKDMNMSGESCSPWLQVGIASTSDVRDDP